MSRLGKWVGRPIRWWEWMLLAAAIIGPPTYRLVQILLEGGQE
jgi:hypothetical protein